MFRRKKTEGDDTRTEAEAKDIALNVPLSKNTARAAMPGGSLTGPPNMPPRIPAAPPRAGGDFSVPPRLAGDPARPMELPRRMTDTSPNASSFAPAQPAASTAPVRQEHSTRQLIVGREISLSGEITACDRLIVEGSVEANLANCRDIDIAESGLFKGSASIDEAEIRGRFDGDLTVRKRLLIRSTGKVVGTIRYGQIEIECGGQISGDIQSVAMAEDGAIQPIETIRPVLTGDRPQLERSDLHPARVN